MRSLASPFRIALLLATLLAAARQEGVWAATAPAGNAELSLIPWPQKVEAAPGRFALSGTVAISAGDEAEDAFAARLLAAELDSSGVHATLEREGGAIVLARGGNRAELGDEGYRLEVRANGVRVEAPTGAGVFYGVQTLRQLIRPGGIPCVTITDRPALRWRGAHDDLSRGPIPTIPTLERRIALAAEAKLNLYVLYFEHTVAYRARPWLAPAGSLTPAELQALAGFALRHHVTLVPEQQTTGHLHAVLRNEVESALAERPGGSTLSPEAPGAYEFVGSMYDELAPAFPGPFFHVGADEVDEIGLGLSAERVKRDGLEATYVAHLKALRDRLARHGKRLLFWSDFLNGHAEVARQIPREYVAASWCYEKRADYAPLVKPLRDAGLDVMVCPGTLNWNRIFPNLDVAMTSIRMFCREGQRGGAIGAITCAWNDNGDAPFALNWYPLWFGAAAAWQSGEADPARFARAYDWALFRNPGHEVAEAMDSLSFGHRLVQSIRPTDANLELFWLNPLDGVPERQLMGAVEPVARPMRLAAEHALERCARAREHARAHADLLAPVEFAARRFETLGLRARVARRVPALYQKLLEQVAAGASRGDQSKTVLEIQQWLSDGFEDIEALSAEQARLWNGENDPAWLGNLTGRYDQDARTWLHAQAQFRTLNLYVLLGRKLPTAAEMGLAP